MVIPNNGLASGLDLSALFPRYFTIRRGMLLMCAISFITQPWELLDGASKFITVLSGYGVFIGPMMGVMYADYQSIGLTTMAVALMMISPSPTVGYSAGPTSMGSARAVIINNTTANSDYPTMS
jgi:cytosine/uracil/thiamine/allantoin permease